MKKHTILFLAANPNGYSWMALAREARAIQEELERSGFRDCLELVTRWAVEPLDLLRELRKLKPTVVHFSGLGGRSLVDEHRTERASSRKGVDKTGFEESEQCHGLFFQGRDGRAQFVSARALDETFGAMLAPVKLVVLNSCYTEVQAEALLAHADCVVGMSGSIHGDAARSFAIGFYGGLGARESVAAAYKQGRAAISLEGLRDADRPQLKVRAGVDASQLILAVPPRAERPMEPAQEVITPGEPPADMPAEDDFLRATCTGWFQAALKAGPPLKWELAVVAMSVFFTIARSHAGGPQNIILSALVIIGLAIILALFASFAGKCKARDIRIEAPIYIGGYLVTISMIFSGALTLTSVWFGWPILEMEIGAPSQPDAATEGRASERENAIVVTRGGGSNPTRSDPGALVSPPATTAGTEPGSPPPTAAAVKPPLAAAPEKHDFSAEIAARTERILTRFVAWSRDYRGAPCPEIAALGDLPRDPWGRAFRLTCTDQPGDQIIGAISAGPDGTPGTSDDIASWQLGRGVTDLVRGARWIAATRLARPEPGPSADANRKRMSPATKSVEARSVGTKRVEAKSPAATQPEQAEIELDEFGIPIQRKR